MQRATDPRHLPELVATIARDDGLWAAQRALSEAMGRKDFEHAENMRGWLEDAKLWWIDADACDLVEYAAPTMPGVTLALPLVPSLSGFIAFARPLPGISEDPEAPIDVDYISWFPCIVEDQESISIVCWHHMEHKLHAFPLALGRSDWPFGDDTDEPYPDLILDRAIGDTPTTLERTMLSIIEDRRWVAAIWQLASQRGLTRSGEVKADRPSQKRILRMGAMPSPVRVVHLPHHGRASGASGSREYHHRWTVGLPNGRWAMRAYGPGRSLRRAVWIAPYMKGPKGAPLLLPRPTVQVLHGTDTDTETT